MIRAMWLKLPAAPPASSPLWHVIYRLFDLNVLAYKATGGRIGGNFGPVKILILHHVGRKSGKRRETALLYIPDGDKLVIVASKGGVDSHPAWYHNLKADPDTTVQVGTRTRPVRARETTDDERAHYWPRLLKVWPQYEDYQRRTKCKIPVLVLEPR